MPNNLAYKVLNYAHRTYPTTPHFSATTLFDLQTRAKKYLDKRYKTARIHADVLAKHGFTHDEWAEVLRNAGSFYFVPDDRITACNREMRQRIGRLPIINQTSGRNLFFSQLERASAGRVARPTIRRCKGNDGRWHYYLNRTERDA